MPIDAAQADQTAMLRNYIKTAFRSLLRHKGYSLLNILGLAVGMAAFILIFQYVRFENSYDAAVPKKDRIYRIVSDLKSTAETIHQAWTSMPMAINLKREYPQIEDVVRLNERSLLFRRGEVKFMEDHTLFADSSLFKVFDFPLLEGDPLSALKEPFSVVLSQSMAKKYFGSVDPLGKTIQYADSGYALKVTGVMRDLPENVSIRSKIFISMSTARHFEDSVDYNWERFSVISYVLLKSAGDSAALQAQLVPFIERHLGPEIRAEQQNYVLSLEPLRDVYWSSRGGFVSGNRTNLYIFSIIGLFILVIACINFVNLTTARSTERAKEVGIRKVVGAVRYELMRQFLSESVLLCLCSFVLASVLAEATLPFFNSLAGKTISTGIFQNPVIMGVLLGIALLIGLVAGFYPAMVLSGFQPIASLKGRFNTTGQGLVLRRGLVVFQFSISICLIIGTAVVYRQVSYMRGQYLGFSKDQVLVVDEHNDGHKAVFGSEVAKLPNVVSTAFSGSVPGQGTYSAYSKLENKQGVMQVANMDLTYVDFGYLEQYKMKLLAGRFFDQHIATDTDHAMIINESSLPLFGYSTPQQAIGKKFSQWGKEGVIIGVIANYHYQGLQQEIKPLSICINFGDCNYLSVKLGGGNIHETLSAMRKTWEQLVPNNTFDYFFLDKSFNDQYQEEETFGKLFINFAILAIFISCLGLLGLASYSTLQRTKEIGVRRVLGASVVGIVRLLSVDFLRLVAVSCLIAIPVAWILMHQWIQNFAYRTGLGWWIFAGAGGLAILIAAATISYQAIRAAMANPVKSLRTE